MNVEHLLSPGITGEPYSYTGTDSTGEVCAWVARWRAALEADGWVGELTYPYSEGDLSTRYHRDGWIISMLDRPLRWSPDKRQANLCAWGPDGLVVDLPLEYDFEAMQANLRKCGFCGATDVDTQRVAFANRSCSECLPEARRKLEYSGWCS